MNRNAIPRSIQRTAQALLCVVGLSVAGTALAAADHTSSSTSTTREERMGSALDNYRAKVRRNANDGPAQRAEASMQRGAEKTGQAIKRGKDKTLDAVGTGMQKSGEAIDRAGRKVESKAKD